MASMTFTITGDVNVEVTITELANGELGVDITVLDETGSIGDLNGIFFDLADDSITYDINVTGDDVTGTAMKIDGVTKVDSFTNVNGEVVKDLGKFDIGVQFGTAGIGEDDIRSTSFTLSSDAGPLTLDDLALQDFAVRLTSVGEEGGDRDGSLKLGGTAPEAPEVQPAGDAIDDASVVFDSNQAIETDGTTDSYFDFAEGLFSNVLQNDLAEDGTAYTGSVTAVNGDAASVGQQVDGSNGGSIIINADGTFDFSAAGTDGVNDFDHLAEDESLATTFTYAVEGGDTATVTVTVFGAGDAGLGGGDGGGSSDFPFDDFA